MLQSYKIIPNSEHKIQIFTRTDGMIKDRVTDFTYTALYM